MIKIQCLPHNNPPMRNLSSVFLKCDVFINVVDNIQTGNSSKLSTIRMFVLINDPPKNCVLSVYIRFVIFHEFWEHFFVSLFLLLGICINSSIVLTSNILSFQGLDYIRHSNLVESYSKIIT